MAKSDLDQIRGKIDLVDFINKYLPLKKAGRNFKAICPFHTEKTPSFVVSPERQIWHCFGCSKGGDVFTFLMEWERIDFGEALRILAEQTGIKLSYQGTETQAGKLRDRLLALHELAGEFYHYLLTKHASGEAGRMYLKQRGITDQLINTFGLGYAPAGWRNLSKFLRKKGFADKELVLSGLALTSASGLYDRFRKRLIFSLRNHRGQTIGFSGRLLSSEIKEAKYINSPETPIYIKGDSLYGLDITKEAIKKIGSAVVVEGEFDLLSSFQAGVANVVAIKGSALTESQAKLLKRFTERLILALDPDQAGDAATRRGIETVDREGFDIRAVSLNVGKDPDATIRENPSLWKQALRQAKPYYDFLIKSAFVRFGGSEAFAKKKVTDELLPIFAKITNPIIQAHYVKILAEKLGMSEEKIDQVLQKIKFPVSILPPTGSQPVTGKKNRPELLEEYLLTLILQAPDIAAAVDQVSSQIDTEQFNNLTVKRIWQALIKFCQAKIPVDINQFAKQLPAELVPVFDKLYLTDLTTVAEPDAHQKELFGVIIDIKIVQLRQHIKILGQQLTKAEAGNDEQQVSRLVPKLQQATAVLNKLETQKGDKLAKH